MGYVVGRSDHAPYRASITDDGRQSLNRRIYLKSINHTSLPPLIYYLYIMSYSEKLCKLLKIDKI